MKLWYECIFLSMPGCNCVSMECAVLMVHTTAHLYSLICIYVILCWHVLTFLIFLWQNPEPNERRWTDCRLISTLGSKTVKIHIDIIFPNILLVNNLYGGELSGERRSTNCVIFVSFFCDLESLHHCTVQKVLVLRNHYLNNYLTIIL